MDHGAGGRAVAIGAHSQVVGIDVLRFLAAMMVTIYHLAYIEWADPHGRGSLEAIPFLVFRPWAPFVGTGWIGVQIFFVISGFVIAYTANGRSPADFVSGRILRLVPGVWICATASVGALLLSGVAPSAIVKPYLLSLILFPAGPWIASSYWTLPVEIIFYALILATLAGNWFGRIGIVAAVLGLFSLTLWGWVLFFPLFHGTSADPVALLLRSRLAPLTLLPHGCFFAAGVLMWLVTARGPSRSRIGLIFLCLAAGIIQIHHETLRAVAWSGVPANPLVPILVFCGSVALIAASIRWNNAVHAIVGPHAAAIRNIGLMTYPVYLLHQPFGVPFTAWTIRHDVPPAIALLLSITIVLALSWLVATRLEPILRRRMKPLLDTAVRHFGTRMSWAGRSTQRIAST